MNYDMFKSVKCKSVPLEDMFLPIRHTDILNNLLNLLYERPFSTVLVIIVPPRSKILLNMEGIPS